MMASTIGPIPHHPLPYLLTHKLYPISPIPCLTHEVRLLYPGQVCSVGEPRMRKMRSSWSNSSFPGKMGFPTWARGRGMSAKPCHSPLSLRGFCFQSLPHVSPQLSPTSSSAKIHPTLHMSTSGPYLSLPRRSSGGLRGRGEGV